MKSAVHISITSVLSSIISTKYQLSWRVYICTFKGTLKCHYLAKLKHIPYVALNQYNTNVNDIGQQLLHTY